MGGVLSCLEGDYKASDEFYQVRPITQPKIYVILIFLQGLMVSWDVLAANAVFGEASLKEFECLKETQVAPLKRGYPQEEVNGVHEQSNAAQFDQQQIGQVSFLASVVLLFF